MNFDWLNPCPIYFLNSWNQTKTKHQNQPPAAPFGWQQRGETGDGWRQTCNMHNLFIDVSPRFCPTHLPLPFFLKRSLLPRSLPARGGYIFDQHLEATEAGGFIFKFSWPSLLPLPSSGWFQGNSLYRRHGPSALKARTSKDLEKHGVISQVLIAVHSHMAGAAAWPRVDHLTLWGICPVLGPDPSQPRAERNSHVWHLGSDLLLRAPFATWTSAYLLLSLIKMINN